MCAAANPQVHGHPHGHPQRPPPLGPFNPNRKHTEPERWICIYPAYFNSCKSRAEGRIMGKSHCVANPSFQEIRDVLLSAGFSPIVENKQHPKERSKELEYRGRIRVQLKNEDGSPFNAKFPTRTSVLVHLGEMIPQLKSRAGKQQATPQDQQQQQPTGTKKGKKK